MPDRYKQIAFTPAVLAAQEHYYGAPKPPRGLADRDPLTDDEIEFIQTRDSFYLASVIEGDWPYIQHRGGPPGFLHAIDSETLAFADFRGNRQLITTGNLATNPRVALILMDYPRRLRLKILGTAKIEDAYEHPELVEQLAEPAERKLVERIFFIKVAGYDWNCSQHITQRMTADEVARIIVPLQRRIEELEAQLKQKQ